MIRITLLAASLAVTPPAGPAFEVPGTVTRTSALEYGRGFTPIVVASAGRSGVAVAFECGSDGSAWFAMGAPVTAASAGARMSATIHGRPDIDVIPTQCRVPGAWLRAVVTGGTGSPITLSSLAIEVSQ